MKQSFSCLMSSLSINTVSYFVLLSRIPQVWSGLRLGQISDVTQTSRSSFSWWHHKFAPDIKTTTAKNIHTKAKKKHWLKSKHTFIIIRSFNIFCIFLDVMKCDENHSNQQFIHLAKDPANVCCVWIAVLFLRLLPWPRLFCKRHLYLSETSWYNKGEMR